MIWIVVGCLTRSEGLGGIGVRILPRWNAFANPESEVVLIKVLLPSSKHAIASRLARSLLISGTIGIPSHGRRSGCELVGRCLVSDVLAVVNDSLTGISASTSNVTKFHANPASHIHNHWVSHNHPTHQLPIPLVPSHPAYPSHDS